MADLMAVYKKNAPYVIWTIVALLCALVFLFSRSPSASEKKSKQGTRPTAFGRKVFPAKPCHVYCSIQSEWRNPCVKVRLAGCTSSTVTKVLGRTGRSLHLTALQLEMANLSRVD
ncbi:unnamed protein product [Durusdinium trenchii]|uniref:Uncharacterized protein n=1 Tax=Durusdinium trenchii TaxID=1381693 RepID=A0ABP0IVH5_9DINO